MNQPARWAVLVWAFVFLLGAVAEARPTVSGTLKAFNPGAGRLQIQREDGTVKNVVLRENAVYEVYGNKVAPTTFKPGMRVVVRICGSLADDPLEADLLTDYGSSGRYVTRSAGTPNHTPVGNFATGAGAGGVSPGLPSLGGPSVLGPLGMGGNFQGSLTNPGIHGPVQNSAYPSIPQMTPGANTGAQPSPLGSPFTGQAVANPSGAANPYVAPGPAGATNPYGAPNPYVAPGPAGAANPYGVPNPYGAPGPAGAASPYGAQSPSAMLGVDQSAGGPSVASMINGSEDEDEDEEGSNFGFNANAGGPLGMQVVQFQARVLSADPQNRVLTVVPAGATYPIQVALPPAIYPVHGGTGQAVPVESIRPGQGVMVHGLSNSAGIVEARQVQVTQ